MPRASNELRDKPSLPGDSREAPRTLAFFYIPLYRVLHLSAIEDTYIKDTAEPDPSIPAALSVRVGHHLALPPGHSFSPDRPKTDSTKQLPAVFQMLPQFAKATVIMMANI